MGTNTWWWPPLHAAVGGQPLTPPEAMGVFVGWESRGLPPSRADPLKLDHLAGASAPPQAETLPTGAWRRAGLRALQTPSVTSAVPALTVSPCELRVPSTPGLAKSLVCKREPGLELDLPGICQPQTGFGGGTLPSFVPGLCRWLPSLPSCSWCQPETRVKAQSFFQL